MPRTDEAKLGHGRSHSGIQLSRGRTSGGTSVRSSSGMVIEESRRHLAPAGIVNADEQHLRSVRGDPALDLGECAKALSGESFD
jgi:hypothetical protein